MGERAKCLAPAALLTVLDAVVVINYGGMVWKVSSTMIWSKLLLLLVATVWATTLLHVWCIAYSHLRYKIHGHSVVESIPVQGRQAQFAGEIDV